MYKRMLIPLDGSEIAETLLPYVKEIAGRLGLKMTFLYVCSPHESESPATCLAYVENAAEITASQAREFREKAGIQTQGEELKAEGKIVEGHPAEEILRFADENEVDLILMTTHGRSGIKRWALGSVADKVLRSSTVPVLLVRSGTPERTTDDEGLVRKILVTLDGSEIAESILPYVETLAKQWNARLLDVVLLMVCEPLVIPPIYAPDMEAPVNWGNLVEEHIAYSKKAADQYLTGVAMRLNDAGLKVNSVVLEGAPAGEIINYANENPYSLIAIATHGRSGISRWAYGSIAEKVLSGASSPIFLVRPPSAESLPLLQTFVGTVRSLPPL